MTKASAIFLAVFASAGLYASCGAQSGADTQEFADCRFDTQCKFDRTCEQGFCVPKKSVSDGGSANEAGSGGAPGGGAFGGGAPAGGAPADDPREVRALNTHIVAHSLLADPSRGLVYATVLGGAAEHANRLIAIDANGEIASSIHIGSDPTSMAISDDYTTLWVSLRGSFSIRRVDLTGDQPRPGIEHRIPPGELGQLGAAWPMVVLPGETDSVAISVHLLDSRPSFDGVVVLDAGVARPGRTHGHTGAARLTGGPQGYLFGFDNYSGFELYSIRISAQGLTQTEHVDLVDGFGVDIVYHDKWVFASTGSVVDVSDPASPRRAGVFAFHGSVIPQQDGTVLMLSNSNSFDDTEAMLRLLDVATFTQLKSAPAGMGGSTVVTSFVRIGPGSYAALADEVYLLSAPSFEQ